MNLTTENIPHLLHQYFPQLAEQALQNEIAEVGKVMHFDEGEVIMDFGSYIKLIPLILKGSIKVLRENEEGHEIFLYFLEAGQTCSASFNCCMMHKKSIIRTVAEEPTTLIGIPVKYMDAWMTRYQSWKNFIMLSYEARFDELLQTIDTIAFQQMDQRLIAYLEKKKQVTQSSTLQATHQEIATDLHASREAISRLLKKLEKDGKVVLGRNKIEVVG